MRSPRVVASPQPPILSVYPTQKERAFWRPQPLQLLANYQAFQATKGNYRYFFDAYRKVTSSNTFISTCRLFQIAYEGDFRSLCTVTF